MITSSNLASTAFQFLFDAIEFTPEGGDSVVAAAARLVHTQVRDRLQHDFARSFQLLA